MKGGCANHYIYIFGFCNISIQRQLVISYCSSFYGLCISMMRFNLHGAKLSGNILITSSLLLYDTTTTTTFSRMSPDSNSDHESNGVLYTE